MRGAVKGMANKSGALNCMVRCQVSCVVGVVPRHVVPECVGWSVWSRVP